MTQQFVTLPTPDHGTLQFELAGLGSRFCAHLLDALLMGLATALFVGVLFALGLFKSGGFADSAENAGSWTASWSVALLLLVVFLVIWGYYVFFECVLNGSTPGKRELGIRVIRDDGLPIGFQESALRNLVRAADALPPPFYLLGASVMFLDRYGRRLGDMVAGTLVVRERFEFPSANSVTGAAWAARVEKGRSRQAVTLPGGAVTPAQVDLAEQYLGRRLSLPVERRDALAWQITAPLLRLKGEDVKAWENDPHRTAACEQFLLGLVELAKAPAARTVAPTPLTVAESLFRQY